MADESVTPEYFSSPISYNFERSTCRCDFIHGHHNVYNMSQNGICFPQINIFKYSI